MRTAVLIGALAVLSPLMPSTGLVAADGADAAAVTVEERLAALEAEVAALRAQLDTEALAKAIAEQMVVAQRKALEPPSDEEAVATLAEKHGLEPATRAKVVAVLATQDAEQQDFYAKMRNGEIPRDQIRDQLAALREKHQQQLGDLLSEEQIEALREAQRPPAMAGRGGWGGRGGGWGGRGGDRGDRGGDRGDRGGRERGDAGGDTGRADF